MYKKENTFNKMACIPQEEPDFTEQIPSPNCDVPATVKNTKHDLEYNGKISLQIPKSLYYRLSEMAKEEHVTLEQFIFYKLAEITKQDFS